MEKVFLKYTKPSIILLGFITFITQIILLREFLTFFNGNELVIGIILANWMLLTGLGAYIGRFFKKHQNRQKIIFSLLTILIFIPALTVFMLHFLWNTFCPGGVMVGVTQVFYYSLVLLAPFCVIAGMLFTLIATDESFLSEKNRVDAIYAWESTGSMMGGLILNFVLVWYFKTFESLYILMAIGVFVTLYLAVKTNHMFISGILIFVFLAFNFLYFQNDLDKSVRELSFPNQEIQYVKDTPFGLLAITKQAEQTNYYENNVLMASSGDVTVKEEAAHFPMVQHDKPENVLVLSGIITGILDEIVKYPVQKIDYVDVNPWIIKIAQEFFKTDSLKPVHIIKDDPLRYLKSVGQKYDVVIMNLPKPSTIQFNRFYSQEFFSLLKNHLTTNAVISFSMPSSSNYLNEEARNLLSILNKTLKTVFNHVLILPGSEDYILASDKELTCQITEQIAAKNISTQYVNSFYFDDDLLKSRSQMIMEQLTDDVPLNKSYNPVCYQSQIKLWLSHFDVNYWLPALIILVFSGFFFVRASAVNKGVFAAGFAGTSIEFVLLLVFQVIYGYVYVVAGMFIMIFMGGLAVGAYYTPKVLKTIDRKLFSRILLFIAVFVFVLPAIFILLKNIYLSNVIIFITFFLLLAFISISTGVVFSMATRLSHNSHGVIASNVYGLDLLGAAAGALLFAIYLVPVAGFLWSVVITGVLNLFVAGWVWVKK
jgi:spermidine synthase